MKMRWSPQMIAVLSEFLQSIHDWKYGYEISLDTGLKSGTLYPILMRLADRGLVETSWESAEPGKPPRHLYKLTGAGARFAREQVYSARNSSRLPNLTEEKSL